MKKGKDKCNRHNRKPIGRPRIHDPNPLLDAAKVKEDGYFYSDDFKTNVVRLVKAGLSVNEAAEKFGVASNSIRRWLQDPDKIIAEADAKCEVIEEYQASYKNSLVRQHSMYLLIEEAIDKRLVKVYKKLIEKDINEFDEIKLKDLLSLIPNIFKESREVFKLKAEQERLLSKRTGQVIDQKLVMEDPMLLEKFQILRKLQEEFMKLFNAKVAEGEASESLQTPAVI